MHSVINKLDKVRLVFRGKASVSAHFEPGSIIYNLLGQHHFFSFSSFFFFFFLPSFGASSLEFFISSCTPLLLLPNLSMVPSATDFFSYLHLELLH